MSEIKAITMPRWGLEMMEGTLSAWHVKVGDTVAAGQVIMDVESEKIANEVESEASGTLRRILVEAGDTVDIGTLLAVIASPDTPEEAIDTFVRDHRPATFNQADAEAEQPEPVQAPAPATRRPGAARDGQRAEGPHASPTARRLAAKLGVDLSRVKGTGRGGRISTEDVEAAAVQQAEPKTAAGAECDYEIVKLDTMRKTIARRLVESKQEVPHFYLSIDLPADQLLDARAQLKSDGSQATLNDLLIKACALAMQDVPEANVQFHGDVLHRFKDADIAFAVATDGGLITPVVRKANDKSLDMLVRESRDLAERGRAGKLAASEFQGGVMTLSNLGMYGVDSFAAVINPPQSAILAVGAARQRAVARDGAVSVAGVIAATLSCDHRAIDGALGARWLDALRERVASPRDWL